MYQNKTNLNLSHTSNESNSLLYFAKETSEMFKFYV